MRGVSRLAAGGGMGMVNLARRSSKDGCAVFWRKSKFELAAFEGFDFVDRADTGGTALKDRTCVLVLLRWATARYGGFVLLFKCIPLDIYFFIFKGYTLRFGFFSLLKGVPLEIVLFFGF